MLQDSLRLVRVADVRLQNADLGSKLPEAGKSRFGLGRGGASAHQRQVPGTLLDHPPRHLQTEIAQPAGYQIAAALPIGALAAVRPWRVCTRRAASRSSPRQAT